MSIRQDRFGLGDARIVCTLSSNINLTGDYFWAETPLLDAHGFRPIPFTL